MTTIAEFDPEPDTYLLRNLLVLLLVSAVLHGISLSLLNWSPKLALPSSIVPIELSMDSSTPHPPSEENLVQPETQSERPIEPVTEHIPKSKTQSTVASSSTVEQLPKTKNLVYDLPLKQWNAPGCNAQQKRTAGHKCSQESEANNHTYTRVHEQHLTNLFREERSASAQRAADLRAIDALLAQQAAVDDALSNFDKPPAYLLSEKNRINSELARIDKKYSSVNLLKVLGSTYKTAKKLVSPQSRD